MSRVARPKRLNGESPTKIERSRIMWNIVVVLEHDCYQHVSSNEGVDEKEENHKYFGVDYGIISRYIQLNIAKESLEK